MADQLDARDTNKPAAEEPSGSSSNDTPAEFIQDDKTPRLQRSQLRAAISSIYHTRPATGPLSLPPEAEIEEPKNKPLIEITPTAAPDESEVEKAKKAGQVEALIEKAEQLARNGEQERARQLYSQSVRLDPTNSEAWCGLGRLLSEQNPERARYCLMRALAIDPQNELAKLLLKSLDEPEPAPPPSAPEAPRALVRLETDYPATEFPTSAADSDTDSVASDKRMVKIGLEEALEIMRQSGLQADPQSLPEGGARFKEAIESGVLKPGRIRPRRRLRLPLPQVSVSGLALSMFLLVSLALLSAVGMFFVIAQPSFEQPPATPTALPVPTLTVEENFAFKLRVELDKYNRYLTNIKSLVDRQRANKVQWEEFRKGFDDLQKQLRDEKKAVDVLASAVQPKFLNVYRGLQDLAITSITGADYMVSGIHNYEPDDLDEGLRQFSRASNQLADLAGQLNQIAPAPTTTPGLSNTANPAATTATPNSAGLTSPAPTGSSSLAPANFNTTTPASADVTPLATTTPTDIGSSPAATTTNSTEVAAPPTPNSTGATPTSTPGP